MQQVIMLKKKTALDFLSENWGKFSGKELSQQQQFFNCLLDYNFSQTIRLMTPREMAGKHLRQGFYRSIGNLLSEKTNNQLTEDHKLLLNEFISFIPEKMARGTCFDVTWFEPNTIVVSIDGKPVGSVKSKNFAEAFFGMYFSSSTVDKALRDEFALGFSKYLSLKANP